jgi:hypothetical protein
MPPPMLGLVPVTIATFPSSRISRDLAFPGDGYERALETYIQG